MTPQRILIQRLNVARKAWMNKIGIATKRWTMLRNVIQAPRMKECINYTKNFILEGFKADQSRKKKLIS